MLYECVHGREHRPCRARARARVCTHVDDHVEHDHRSSIVRLAVCARARARVHTHTHDFDNTTAAMCTLCGGQQTAAAAAHGSDQVNGMRACVCVCTVARVRDARERTDTRAHSGVLLGTNRLIEIFIKNYVINIEQRSARGKRFVFWAFFFS